MYLFLDTTQNVTVGILNKDMSWAHYEYTETKKSSTVLHQIIHEQLEKLNINTSSLEACFYIAGPGSYTGMRVSDGLAQILEWSGIKLYSFYHFNIASYLSYKTGAWYEKAFKKEVFLYKWNESEESKQLLKESDFKVPEGALSISDTRELVKNNPKELFSYVLKKGIRSPLFYYRDLEDEFGRSNV